MELSLEIEYKPFFLSEGPLNQCSAKNVRLTMMI